ncbi:MAG TPA: hypothetical protein PKD54_15685, partial [Pirellulaceae bacterium]|nr:hypothetical protein [Pirellulaceae bacterium]
MRRDFRLIALLFCIWSTVAVQYLDADIIYYPDQAGTHVTFTNIRESSSSIGNGPGQVPELYGSPIGVGANTLVFRPALFEAKSVGMEIELIDGQLSFKVCSLPGFLIDRISIKEFGDFTLATPFPGGAAFVSASLTGLASTPDGSFSANAAFTDFHTQAISTGKFGLPWTNSIDIFLPPTKCVEFDLDNTLTAASSALAAAIIKKKRV